MEANYILKTVNPKILQSKATEVCLKRFIVENLKDSWIVIASSLNGEIR